MIDTQDTSKGDTCTGTPSSEALEALIESLLEFIISTMGDDLLKEIEDTTITGGQ